MRELFEQSMNEVFQAIMEPVRLTGDGRFDTPGLSALYGVYTIMDARTSKILASNLVKVRMYMIANTICFQHSIDTITNIV